jgi:hypothetical protein
MIGCWATSAAATVAASIKSGRATVNFTAAQMPNFTVHSKADVKHSDMFLDVLETYVAREREPDVLATATDSMDIHRVYFGGMAQAMKRLS